MTLLAFPERIPELVERGIAGGSVALARQFGVSALETEQGCRDPLGEQGGSRAGLISKYPGRVLLLVSAQCPVHCRYCFRRNDPMDDALDRGGMDGALELIKQDPTIREVILSGGDPLMASDAFLAELLRRLGPIPHVEHVRVHTRMPLVVPRRVSPGLLQALVGPRPLWMVVHVNHVDELSAPAREALARLVDGGIPVLAQAVLLAGVNDSVEALEALCRGLLACRVQPYYLHALDPVAGALHFAVPDERGQELVAELRERLPGFAVPRFVREEVGRSFKTPLG